MKEHGQPGIVGVLAQGLAIQTPELVQCFTMVTCHALERQVKQGTVKVRVWFKPDCYKTHSSWVNVLLVEGSWTAWGAFGTCSATCGTGSQSQRRGFSGNRPCSSSDTNTQSCIGKIFCDKLSYFHDANWEQAFPQICFPTIPHLVEGAWSSWGQWGACTTTCNSGSRTRTRIYTGGAPCTGSSSETGNCVGEKTYYYISNYVSFRNINTCRLKLSFKKYVLHNLFQLRDLGQDGEPLVHVQ